jgi:hypothetical protein
MKPYGFFALSVVAASLFTSGSGAAQTLVGVSTGGGALLEVNGSPAGPCNTPFPPDFPLFGLDTFLHPCALPLIPPLPLTDVAMLPLWNELWVTDGIQVLGYYNLPNPASGHDAWIPTRGMSFPLGSLLSGPIVALGGQADLVNGLLALCDGTSIVFLNMPAPGIPLPPNFPLCAWPAPYVPPAFTQPGTSGLLTGTITDVDVVFSGGVVTAVYASTTGGTVLTWSGGVWSSFGVVTDPECLSGLGTPLVLTGVAVDRSQPGAGVVYVSSASNARRFGPGGAAVPTTFALPSECTHSLNAFGEGLAYTGRGNSFGSGLGSTKLTTKGQFTYGDFGFGLMVTGALDAVYGIVYVSTSFLCPELYVSSKISLNLGLAPPPIAVAPAVPISATTMLASIPLTNPALLTGIGKTFFTQIVGVSTAPSINGAFTTKGLAVTLLAP